MNNIKLFNECCIINNNSINIYGQYDKIQIEDIKCFNANNEIINSKFSLCNLKPDFCITLIKNKNVKNISISFNNKIIFKNIKLNYLSTNKLSYLKYDTSNIIITMCKNYNHRLDEWIKYNLYLGFDAIVIFDNSKNNKNGINEENEKYENIKLITNKYKKKIYVIDFPQSPLNNYHWNSIQRISFNIGTNLFFKKCKYITLIDADEFIFLPNNNNIKNITLKYDNSLRISSKLLTNKHNNNNINNNILSICKYIGKNHYTKVMLRTNKIGNCYGAIKNVNFFIISPHKYPSDIKISKKEIMYFHCWVNKRHKHNKEMEYFNLNKIFKIGKIKKILNKKGEEE